MNKFQKEFVEAMELFLKDSTYLKKRFVDSILNSYLTGTEFTECLVAESKNITNDFKLIKKSLPKGKRKSKK